VVQAIVLHLEGKLDEAIQEIRAGLLNGEPAAELYAAMGALQMERERFEDAAASYREVLKCEPENEASKRNLALCVEKVNEAKKPPKPPPSLLKAIALHKEGKAEEAGKELQRGIKSGEPPVELYTAVGHLQFEGGRFDLAAEAYREALKLQPEHKTCHYNLAVCLEKTGRYKDALGSYRKAFEIAPQRIEAGIGAGVTLLHLKRFAEAAEMFETCLKSRPEDATALFGKAFAWQALGRRAEAEAVYLEALQRDPAQREGPLGPVRGPLVVAGQAFQQQQVGRVAEMRDERVYQLAGQVIDVERVADPGERVIEHQPAHERGIDEPFRSRCGDAEQGERGQAGPGGPHWMDGHHGLGRVTVAGLDREHGAALAIGTDRLEQPVHRRDAVRLPGGVRIRVRRVSLGAR